MSGVDATVHIPTALTELADEVAHRAGETRGIRVRRAIERLFRDAMVRTGDHTIAVITGDIPAMWLRDSTWQLRPLLAAAKDDAVYSVLAAVSRQQAQYVSIDPYANAFNLEPNGNCWHRDFADQSPWVFERKYELDSLTSFLDLAIRLYAASGRSDHFDPAFAHAAEIAVDVIKREQRHDPNSYRFRRLGSPAHDQLSHNGRGAPLGFTGMSWSGFRPSDDGCELGYLVPSNAHAVVVLRQLADLPADVLAGGDLKLRARRLSDEIDYAIRNHAIFSGLAGDYLAYEVDGLGNHLFMDDANVPSLLSLPYLGWCAADDPLYLSTRSRVLSDANPYFVTGSRASGVGSPHTPSNHVWPIGIAVAALTDTAPDACEQALLLLESTDAGTGDMHESFHADKPDRFTRPWFSWADMMYVHVALRSADLAFD